MSSISVLTSDGSKSSADGLSPLVAGEFCGRRLQMAAEATRTGKGNVSLKKKSTRPRGQKTNISLKNNITTKYTRTKYFQRGDMLDCLGSVICKQAVYKLVANIY